MQLLRITPQRPVSILKTLEIAKKEHILGPTDENIKPLIIYLICNNKGS